MHSLEIPVTEGDELDRLGKLLKRCPVCSALTLCTVNYKYLMIRLTMMTKLISNEHWDSFPCPWLRGNGGKLPHVGETLHTPIGHSQLMAVQCPQNESWGCYETVLEVLTADVEAPTISSHVSFGHAILICSTSRKEKGAWDRVELFTATAG